MLEPVPVYGKYKNTSGIIISINLDNSGFITHGTFKKENPDDIAFNMVLEIADVNQNNISYLPMKNDTIIAEDSSQMNFVMPIINNPDDLETTTVIINHKDLASDNITNLYSLIKNAWDYLDTTYPKHMLWNKIKGKNIKVKGIELNDAIIASSIDVKTLEDMNESNADFELVESANNTLNDKFNNSFSLSIPDDTIKYLTFRKYPNKQYENNKGKLKLDENNNWDVIM